MVKVGYWPSKCVLSALTSDGSGFHVVCSFLRWPLTLTCQRQLGEGGLDQPLECLLLIGQTKWIFPCAVQQCHLSVHFHSSMIWADTIPEVSHSSLHLFLFSRFFRFLPAPPPVSAPRLVRSSFSGIRPTVQPLIGSKSPVFVLVVERRFTCSTYLESLKDHGSSPTVHMCFVDLEKELVRFYHDCIPTFKIALNALNTLLVHGSITCKGRNHSPSKSRRSRSRSTWRLSTFCRWKRRFLTMLLSLPAEPGRSNPFVKTMCSSLTRQTEEDQILQRTATSHKKMERMRKESSEMS